MNLFLLSSELAKAALSPGERKKGGSVESGDGEGEFVGYRMRCLGWPVSPGAETGLVTSADDSEPESASDSESDSEADESDEEDEDDSDEDADEEAPSTSIASCEAG